MLKKLPTFSLALSIAAGSMSLYANENLQELEDNAYIADSYRKNSQKQKASMKMQKPCQDMTAFSACPNHVRLSGDYLYLLPSLEDTYFVIASDTFKPYATVSGDIDTAQQPAVGTRLNNDFRFHSGFRVGAEFSMCHGEREIEVYYSNLSTHKNRTVSAPFMWATSCSEGIVQAFDPFTFYPVFQAYQGTATSHLSVMYQRVDADFSQQLVNAHGTHFYVKAGLEYVYLRLRDHRQYMSTGTALESLPTTGNTIPFPSTAIYQQTSKSSGIGPQIGLALDYNFYESKCTQSVRHIFSMTGLLSGSLLVCRARVGTFASSTVYDTEFLGFDDVVYQDLHDERTWKFVPALHAQVAFSYTCRGRSVGLTLDVGYEFNTYINALSRTIFPDSGNTSGSFSRYEDFDMQGLFVNAGLSF